MRQPPSHERRSSRPDRRVADAARPPGGVERRVGPRRRLPRPLWRQWPSLLISAGLGVVVAVSVQRAPATPPPAPQPASPPTVLVELPFTRAEAAALRDEAERLTPAAVALDERAQLRWWPLRPELEAAVADLRLPTDLRDELTATLAALERSGL